MQAPFIINLSSKHRSLTRKVAYGLPREETSFTGREKPLITDKQISEIGPGIQIFHKSFGYGEVVDVDGSYVSLFFESNPNKIRKFEFPGTFYQGLLQLR